MEVFDTTKHPKCIASAEMSLQTLATWHRLSAVYQCDFNLR